MKVIIEIIIPIITAFLGFLGGCKFERNKKAKASIKGNDNIIVQNSNIGK